MTPSTPLTIVESNEHSIGGGMDAVIGKAQAVLGTIKPADLGIVLTHEHIFARFHVWFCPPETVVDEAFWEAAFALIVRRRWTSIAGRGAGAARSMLPSTVSR